jgi:drug/metabolite transporter (DMT)-like permease
MSEKKDLSFLATAVLVNCYELLFTLSTTINHEATKFRGVSVIEYAFVRNLINFLTAAGFLCYRKLTPWNGITKEHLTPLFLRTIIGNLGFFTFTLVYKLLPLGIGATLIASNPIVISILAFLFLQEQ